MRKIPTIFERDWDGDRSRVLNTPVAGCEWVFAGEGTATRKYDGTCVMLADIREWWARREVRAGKPAPPGFVLVEHDDETGKSVGWEPIEQSSFAKWHAQALTTMDYWAPGTYELVGPKVQGNPERFDTHTLIRHADAEELDVPRDFDGIRNYLATLADGGEYIEGIVFHHEDGRMGKIKSRDFGIKPHV